MAVAGNPGAADYIDHKFFSDEPILYENNTLVENLQNAYRDGDWKYLKTSDGEFLFNLKNDLGEVNNLRDVNPEIFDRLKREFEKLDAQMLKRLSI